MARPPIAGGLFLAGRPAFDTSEAHVWCFQIGREDHTLELAYRLLSREERERAARFRVDGAMRSFVVSRAVTRTILGVVCGAAPEDVQFAYTAKGKPFVSSTMQSPHFNVSHSGDLVACALSARAPIGVDIEGHRAISDWAQIARSYFCENEWRSLDGVPGSCRVTAFYDCWVRKEAVVKALGGGLSIPLDSFEVSVRPDAPAALLAMEGVANEAGEWTLSAFRPDSGYSGAVALRVPGAQICVYETRPALELLS